MFGLVTGSRTALATPGMNILEIMGKRASRLFNLFTYSGTSYARNLLLGQQHGVEFGIFESRYWPMVE